MASFRRLASIGGETNTIIIAAEPDAFWYRVVMDADPGGTGTFPGAADAQWSRIKNDETTELGGTKFFEADFSVAVIPEPSTLTMVLVWLGGLGLIRRRRRSS